MIVVSVMGDSIGHSEVKLAFLINDAQFECVYYPFEGGAHKEGGWVDFAISILRNTRNALFA